MESCNAFLDGEGGKSQRPLPTSHTSRSCRRNERLPLSLQQKFAALVDRAEHLRAVRREALRQADRLFACLVHRGFGD
jgi:hypothetical protein